MATQAYYNWVEAGRPWTPAQPIHDILEWAEANDVEVLGTLGNRDHLEADPPEDHTPFSATAWPDPLPGYIVTAIDLVNKDGLGERIEAAGLAGDLPYLKYMNHSGRHIDFRNGSVRRSADKHVHLSIRTDWIYRAITVDFYGGQDMTPSQEQTLNDTSDRSAITLNEVRALREDLEALKAALPTTGGSVDEETLERVLRRVLRSVPEEA